MGSDFRASNQTFLLVRRVPMALLIKSRTIEIYEGTATIYGSQNSNYQYIYNSGEYQDLRGGNKI